MKKTVVAATVLSSLIAFHSTACELHAGMGNMQFGFQHPMMQQHLAAAKEPLISLNIDRKREVAKLEASAVPLRFTIPSNYKEVSVDVMASDGVTLLSPHRFSLPSTKGEQAISFQAQEEGTHELVLKVYALKKNVPVTYTRKVKILAS